MTLDLNTKNSLALISPFLYSSGQYGYFLVIFRASVPFKFSQVNCKIRNYYDFTKYLHRHSTDLGSLIENTLCGNFRKFSTTHNLHEINFGHLKAPKPAILTIWAPLNFEFLRTFDIFKCEICPKIKILSLQNCKNNKF